ncbi:MAG: 2'-5' RNA ligase family protein [Candidatus Peregrinibacteria bacterium]|nr:2'-5' RNA ligase family protein [Candidatus Peregrinibacteria bacterium]
MRSSLFSSAENMEPLVFPLRSCFVAVPLTGDALAHFLSVQDALKPWSEILRFQKRETPHLTLQFWKEILEIEYTQLLKQVPTIAGKAEPFTLRIAGVDAFRSRGLANVLFLDVPFSEPLARLKKLCPWPSIGPFHPHVTIARIRHPQRFVTEEKRIMKAIVNTSFTMEVDQLTLYATVGEQNQTPLLTFPLGGVS